MTLIKPSKTRLFSNTVVVNLLILCFPFGVLLLVTGDQGYLDSAKFALPIFLILVLGMGLARNKSNMDDIEIHQDHIKGPGPFKFNSNNRIQVALSFDELAAHPYTDSFGVIILGDKSGPHIRIVRDLYEPAELDELFEKLPLQKN